MRDSKINWTTSLATVLLFAAACGGDDAASQSSSAASSGDCKKANDLAKKCDIDPFNCKEDGIQVACALEYSSAYCEVEGDYFACIASKANERDSKK
jgi:hypothetical protein